ncbi:hypothetical protein Pcar_3492 [Syntrophotalea carbinolica DSM 2380]|uniref:Uncharacterized protein n=1 Tax=Syntrophotalea carbinolica (strain DSM 2380 / NBRC 103641 / GraBd1) TaxID=338963 RepID=J9UIB0_SYNC1|nr:hypothetical protein [Syntrophotalea carbinolica]AFR67636.1 hypothetical protein Pcar_3492 [Syntrophotalea carbinolica DSM 2380]
MSFLKKICVIFILIMSTSSIVNAENLTNEEATKIAIQHYRNLENESTQVMMKIIQLNDKEYIYNKLKTAETRAELDAVFSSLEKDFEEANGELLLLSEKMYFVKIRAFAAGIDLNK